MNCSIEGCIRPATRRGMCQLHYRRVKAHNDPNHTNRRHNADGRGYHNVDDRGEHVAIAETALGHPLPKGAEVHHVNGDPSDNSRSNLVICENAKYHALLHIRARALRVAGNANYRKCKICGLYSPPGDVTVLSNGAVYHPQCNRDHVRKYAKAVA